MTYKEKASYGSSPPCTHKNEYFSFDICQMRSTQETDKRLSADWCNYWQTFVKRLSRLSVSCVVVIWSRLSVVASITTGWRKLIGSSKLQIIFHRRATKYRSLLREMTHKDKGAYESSPPCNMRHHTHNMRHHTHNMRVTLHMTWESYDFRAQHDLRHHTHDMRVTSQTHWSWWAVILGPGIYLLQKVCLFVNVFGKQT